VKQQPPGVDSSAAFPLPIPHSTSNLSRLPRSSAGWYWGRIRTAELRTNPTNKTNSTMVFAEPRCLCRDNITSSLNFELLLESDIGKIAQYRTDVRLPNRAPLSFGQNVIRHGRVMFERHPNLRANFEGRILKEYFNFSRFRRRYLHEVTNAPV
jgi:hypothetical protein